MHIHIIGICGTFMGGLAQIALQQGHQVTGCDVSVYPPMSETLERVGIDIIEGFAPSQLSLKPDIVVVGNAISRGNPLLEAVLNQGIPYTSGPQWLAENILSTRHVLAVAGTHGKTTTASLLAWILHACGRQPSYLIGGVPQNFNHSAYLDQGDDFVIEADEYDSAFFDKRPKFMHYRPSVLILNNLEFDHADIYPNLTAIEQQFAYLVRTVPGEGTIILPQQDQHLNHALAQGCWSHKMTLGDHASDWCAVTHSDNPGTEFEVFFRGETQGSVCWPLYGQHNIINALAALAAANSVGIKPTAAIHALAQFKGVQRRLTLVGQVQSVHVYDDFAHHPTAIAATLAALRKKVPLARLIAVVEFGSNTMVKGHFQADLVKAFVNADKVVLLRSDKLQWDIDALAQKLTTPVKVCHTVEAIIAELVENSCPNDQIVMMSNKSFEALPKRLLAALEAKGDEGA